jgi:hypothetical protein
MCSRTTRRAVLFERVVVAERLGALQHGERIPGLGDLGRGLVV